MHKPSRRWVSNEEFEQYTSGLPRKHLCALLRRCDRTIRDWQSGRRPIPAWTIDTLRMRERDRQDMLETMFGAVPAPSHPPRRKDTTSPQSNATSP